MPRSCCPLAAGSPSILPKLCFPPNRFCFLPTILCLNPFLGFMRQSTRTPPPHFGFHWHNWKDSILYSSSASHNEDAWVGLRHMHIIGYWILSCMLKQYDLDTSFACLCVYDLDMKKKIRVYICFWLELFPLDLTQYLSITCQKHFIRWLKTRN